MSIAEVGRDGFAMDEAGRKARGRVEKDGEIAAAKRFREFGSPLLRCVDNEFRTGELLPERAGEVQGHRVVTTKRIATSEDDSMVHDGRRTSSSNEPSGARSWMCSGRW